MFYLLHDIKYLAKESAIKFMINETDFIERMLSSLQKLYFIDSIV